MAKSLPSLSSYLSTKNNRSPASLIHESTAGQGGSSVLEQVRSNGNHDQGTSVILNDKSRKKKRFLTSDEDGELSGGSKANTFKTATQKYAMLPSYQKVFQLIFY